MSRRFERELDIKRKTIIDILRDTKFDSFCESLSYSQIIPYSSYSPWNDDLIFLELVGKIKNNTLVDIYRCYELWTLLKNICEVEGDVIEVGVWKGGTASIICSAAAINRKTKVYLFDTFEGVPKVSTMDPVYRGGEHSDTTEKKVNDLLISLNLTNFKILKGIFPDNFNQLEINKCKFCHIDVDTYLSAKDIFEYIWPRMITGGIIIFDDYGFQTCEGVTQYVNEISITNCTKIYNLNGHSILIKTQLISNEQKT